MIAAFLFDCDDPKFEGYYGWPIMECILGTRILQAARYPIDIARGDVLLNRYPQLAQRYLSSALMDDGASACAIGVKAQRARARIAETMLCAWVLHGISKETTAVLHAALWNDSAYLGSHEVDPSRSEQKVLFVSMMISLARIHGTSCTLFYSSENGGERDQGLANELLETRLVDRIDWEDESRPSVGQSRDVPVTSKPDSAVALPIRSVDRRGLATQCQLPRARVACVVPTDDLRCSDSGGVAMMFEMGTGSRNLTGRRAMESNRDERPGAPEVANAPKASDGLETILAELDESLCILETVGVALAARKLGTIGAELATLRRGMRELHRVREALDMMILPDPG